MDTKSEKKKEQKMREERKEGKRTISLKTNTGEIREFPLIKLTKKSRVLLTCFSRQKRCHL